MRAARTLTCGRCSKSENCERQGPHIEIEPPGWSVVTVSGTPTKCLTLCAGCTTDVRQLLATDPAIAIEAGRHAAVTA